MLVNGFVIACILMVNVEAHTVRRDVSSATPPNFLEPFLKNMEQFKDCLDKSLAMSVEQVNEKQLQPVFTALGDSLNRVSKAFEDLTASTKSPNHIF